MRFQLSVAASRCCLVLAVLLPVSFVGAQSTSGPASKPKVKMMARPLPGMGSSSPSAASQSGPSTSDINNAESSARAKVPLFRPAVNPSASRGETLGAGNTAQPSIQDSDRARIVLIRRRGTFEVPKSETPAAPVLVNDATPKPAPIEPVPAALPPGKIRIIPKESIKIGTPPAHP